MNKKTAITLISTLVLLTSCAENKESPEEKTMHTPEIVVPVNSVVKDEVRIKPMPALEQMSARKVKGLAPMGGVATSASQYGSYKMSKSELAFSLNTQWNRESYNSIDANGYINSSNDPLSTFSIDVDTASYANVRRFVTEGRLPPVGAVRVEEMINYFNYTYQEPADNTALAISAEVGPSPYNNDYGLVRIGVKAKNVDSASLPSSNLVFLIDVSGSMNQANKLPLLKQSMKLLVSQLGANDRVSIVVYAGSDYIALHPTSADKKEEIIRAIDTLQPGGSTHASKGINTAYTLAKQVYMPGGNNRVILASDGDFNVGVTSRGELRKLIEKEREGGVYLTVLGFGMGNYHDDTMEVLADKGNGNYAYIDSLLEAKKVLVKEMSGTLFTVANDVKIQVEFNPALVGAYRLIGYENRILADEDFKNDAKDAGEIGVGHTVTALYEIIPAGNKDIPKVDNLKYQRVASLSNNNYGELLTVKVRYKPKGKTDSVEVSKSIEKQSQHRPSDDFRFAAAVAGYGMLLTDSKYINDFSWDTCLDLVRSSRGADAEGYRAEFLKIVEMSQIIKQNG